MKTFIFEVPINLLANVQASNEKEARRALVTALNKATNTEYYGPSNVANTLYIDVNLGDDKTTPADNIPTAILQVEPEEVLVATMLEEREGDDNAS